MKLRVTHVFSAPVAAVCAGMADADFYETLDLPDLERPELLERTERGAQTDLRLRFTYTGQLDPIARRIVGHEHVSWVQRLVVDAAARSAALTVAPEIGVVPVSCTGTFTMRDDDGDGDRCLRTLDGELRVKVPVIGGRAERSLAPGITRRLDLEAAALDSYLAR